jgi:hypothetical protein
MSNSAGAIILTDVPDRRDNAVSRRLTHGTILREATRPRRLSQFCLTGRLTCSLAGLALR